MKTKFLFPNRFKRIGWILLIPSAILGFLVLFFDLEFNFLNLKVFAIFSETLSFSGEGFSSFFCIDENNITDEIVSILFLIGAIFVAFSKEKHEDEFIAKVRLESLVWATYINYAILIFCIVFFFSTGFLTVMILNMFTILLFFIIRFYFILYKTKKSLGHEK